jgi:type I restriction enzyme S subunit
MTTLSDLCLGIVDCEHKTAPVQSEGYPSIRTPNIGRGYFLLDGVNRVSEATYAEWTRREVPQGGDLILAREAPVGNVAVIPEDDRFCLGQRTVLIRPNQALVNPDFLCYLLLTPEMQGRMHGKSGGATVHHLNLKDIRSLAMPVLPSLRVQVQCASVIKGYDDLIAINQRRITLLEDAVRRLYREWFVHLRFPGHESVSVTDGVPQGWSRDALGAKIKTSSGGTPSRKRPDFYGPGAPWIKTKELNDGFLFEAEEEITEAGLEGSSAKIFPAGTVLLAMYGATIGMTALLARPAATNQACCAFLVADTQGLSYYCFQWLKEIKQKLISLGMGAAQPNLSQEVIKKLEFLLPSYQTLDQYHDTVAPLFEQLAVLSQQNKALAHARDLLLPKLMSGQLDVSGIRLPDEATA